MTRKFLKICLALGVIAMLGVVAWRYLNNQSNVPQELVGSLQSGNAPFAVKISPPAQWEHIFRKDCDSAGQDNSKIGAFVGIEFLVDWGDETKTNDSNPKCGLVHTYRNSGSYLVSAKVVSVTDSPAFDEGPLKVLWEWTTKVVVY